jgi:hypothetical protein
LTGWNPVPWHDGHSISATLGGCLPIDPYLFPGTPVFRVGFTGTRSTFAISLCETEFASPSSQAIVTSLQDVPTTVPKSVSVTPQQTRLPTLRVLDWSPVISTTDANHQQCQRFGTQALGLRLAFLSFSPARLASS